MFTHQNINQVENVGHFPLLYISVVSFLFTGGALCSSV